MLHVFILFLNIEKVVSVVIRFLGSLIQRLDQYSDYNLAWFTLYTVQRTLYGVHFTPYVYTKI